MAEKKTFFDIITSPEGFISLFITFFLFDFSEFILEIIQIIPVIGQVLAPAIQVVSILIDIAAFIFVVVWLFIRSEGDVVKLVRRISSVKKSGQPSSKEIKNIAIRLGLMIFEFIPIISSFFPAWTILVYRELKKK